MVRAQKEKINLSGYLVEATSCQTNIGPQTGVNNELMLMLKLMSLPGVQNEGAGCWSGCGSQQGPCAWCGPNGMCCRKGYNGDGCDGTVGGDTGHQCVAASNTNGNIILTVIPMNIVKCRVRPKPISAEYLTEYSAETE